MTLFAVMFFLIAFGDLSILFFDFINFRDINESDMFLSIDLFKFETLIDGVAANKIDSFFDKR